MSAYSFISEIVPGWKCGYCWEKNPDIHGKAVAHANGGELHPIHLDCMLVWRLRSNQCPTCWCKTDVELVTTSAMKLKLKMAYFFRDLKHTFRSPLFRLSAGIICTVIGSRKKQPLLSAFGWFFQWLNIHQIILYGGRHIEIAKRLERLCSQLIVHFNAAQFQELQTTASLHRRYAEILSEQPGIEGVKHLFEVLKKEIRGDQMVRLYRLIAAFSALRFALQSCPLA